MGSEVSNSFNLPSLPPSISPEPNACVLLTGRGAGVGVGAQGFEDGAGGLRGDAIGERMLGEKERRPSVGGGDRARWVSGDASWYGAKSMLISGWWWCCSEGWMSEGGELEVRLRVCQPRGLD